MHKCTYRFRKGLEGEIFVKGTDCEIPWVDRVKSTFKQSTIPVEVQPKLEQRFWCNEQQSTDSWNRGFGAMSNSQPIAGTEVLVQ